MTPEFAAQRSGLFMRMLRRRGRVGPALHIDLSAAFLQMLQGLGLGATQFTRQQTRTGGQHGMGSGSLVENHVLVRMTRGAPWVLVGTEGGGSKSTTPDNML